VLSGECVGARVASRGGDPRCVRFPDAEPAMGEMTGVYL